VESDTLINSLPFSKTVLNLSKLDQELKEDVITKEKYVYLTEKEGIVTLFFDGGLTQELIDQAAYIINNFVDINLKDQLAQYIKLEVEPFINDMIISIQAENIAMGITQDGKTSEVIGFMCNRITIPSSLFQLSLADAIWVNSLYSVVEILEYYIDNESIYDGLEPYITVQRLTEWKTKITDFLA